MKKIICLSTGIFLIDQIIKYIIISKIELYETKEIIKSFFYLTRLNNDGAAFSMFSGNVFILCFISIFILFFFYHSFLKEKKFTNFETIIYGMFLGGTFGNLFDRIIRGVVIDYLDFKIIHYSFPVFNFADIMITISIGLLIYKTIKEDVWKKHV